MHHILSVDQFTKDDLVNFCYKAALHRELQSNWFSPSDISMDLKETLGFPFEWISHNNIWVPRCSKGKLLTALFYETSSRTYASFIAAILKLGGNYIPIHDAKIYSSAAKGETLEDTILQQMQQQQQQQKLQQQHLLLMQEMELTNIQAKHYWISSPF